MPQPEMTNWHDLVRRLLEAHHEGEVTLKPPDVRLLMGEINRLKSKNRELRSQIWGLKELLAVYR